jgi:hypothetical protein
MKASELIEQLQELIYLHGDLLIMGEVGDKFGGVNVEELLYISYNKDYFFIE